MFFVLSRIFFWGAIAISIQIIYYFFNDFICVRRLRLLGVYPGLLWDRALRSYRTAPQGRGGVSPGGQPEGLQCPARWGSKNKVETSSNLANSSKLLHRFIHSARAPGRKLYETLTSRGTFKEPCSRMGSPNSHSLRTPSDDGPVDQRATGHTVSVSRD